MPVKKYVYRGGNIDAEYRDLLGQAGVYNVLWGGSDKKGNKKADYIWKQLVKQKYGKNKVN